jgi:DNA-binding NarL/FixJ family response regulator
MTRAPTTLLLADDHPLVLSGLRQLIASNAAFRVTAVCSDGVAALQAIREHSPDIAVLDLNMPRLDGLSVLDAVAEHASTRVVLLAAVLSDRDVHAAIERGAHGLVLKDAAPDTLMDCLCSVAAGRRWLPADLVDGPIAREQERLGRAASVADLLTSREREIALMASDGRSNKDIARELGLSEGTVKIHLHHIFRKLGVTTRAGLHEVISRYGDRLVRPGKSETS